MARLNRGTNGSGRMLRMVAASCFLAPAAIGADIYVDDSNDSSPWLGTASDPFQTIGAAMNAASSNDTIKVAGGTYNEALGEAFPIAIKNGVDIRGQETAQADWPRIGGDVADSSVRALFEVVGNTSNGDRTGIFLQKLRFEDENTAGKDAPSALYVENVDGRLAEATLDNCIIERGAMNDTGSADRASVVGVGGNRQAEAAGLHVVLLGCTVTPTVQGGVEVGIGSGATGTARAAIDLDVRDSSFVLTGAETSRCAVDFLLEAWSGTTGLNADGYCEINGNLIDSRQCTSAGFTEGIQAGGEAKHGGSVGMKHSDTYITDNEVLGCDTDAIRWFCDQDTATGSGCNIQSWHTARNVLAENGGHGLCIDYGDGAGAGSGPYMDIRTFCNMIVNNASSGVCVKNMDTTNSGHLFLISNTSADNDRYGIELITSSEPTRLRTFQNNIVWDNYLGSASGWSPTDATAGQFTNNDYKGYFGSSSCTPDSNGNVDTLPDFENAATGDYHLKSSSCLIN